MWFSLALIPWNKVPTCKIVYFKVWLWILKNKSQARNLEVGAFFCCGELGEFGWTSRKAAMFAKLWASIGGIGGEVVTEPETVSFLFALLKKTQDAQKGRENNFCVVSLPIAVLKLDREANWETPEHCRTIDIRVERWRVRTWTWRNIWKCREENAILNNFVKQRWGCWKVQTHKNIGKWFILVIN